MGNGDYDRGTGDTHLNCPSSGSMFKSSSNSADPFFASGWDPLLQMGHNPIPNFGPSSHSHDYGGGGGGGIGLGSQAIPSHFSDMAGSFGIHGCGQMGPSDHQITSTNSAHSHGEKQPSSEGAAMVDSPRGKRKRKAAEPNSPFNAFKNDEERKKDVSIENSDNSPNEAEDKRNKSDANLRGKQQMGKAQEIPNNGESPKDSYIHVRARRGQATNSHSLAERVRRERISERMKLLQELVPGCNKITGKAVMLDEIINYVQSLQQQVEFLSMKLATVNPELNVDIERILSKEILHSHSRVGNIAVPGFSPSLNNNNNNPHHSYSPGIQPGNLAGGGPSLIPYHHPPMPQNIWDNDLHNLLQMGFDSNQAINNLGPNGCPKTDL